MRTRIPVLVSVAALLLAGCGSSTETAEPPTDGERPLNRITALGIGNSPIPAGRWGVEVNGIPVEVRAEQTLETVSYDYNASGLGDDVDLLVFQPIPEDPFGGFFVATFEGFVDAVDMRMPTRDDPLTSDEFIAGLSQAIPITDVTESSIAGRDSISWTFGSQDPNSAFACEGDDRSDLEDGDLCTRWGVGGERTVEFATITNTLVVHYIESFGLVVAWAYTDTGTGNPFAELADSLLIDP